MTIPLCKIAQENGGKVPLECLFKCPRDCHAEAKMRVPDAFDRYDAEEEGDQRAEPREVRCNRCGSTDVRWRQQSGRWVLFSSTPGVEHACPINASGYGAVPEDD